MVGSRGIASYKREEAWVSASWKYRVWDVQESVGRSFEFSSAFVRFLSNTANVICDKEQELSLAELSAKSFCILAVGFQTVAFDSSFWKLQNIYKYYLQILSNIWAEK